MDLFVENRKFQILEKGFIYKSYKKSFSFYHKSILFVSKNYFSHIIIIFWCNLKNYIPLSKNIIDHIIILINYTIIIIFHQGTPWGPLGHLLGPP